MFFSRWPGRARQSNLSFRPDVCVLEDRITPALFRPLPTVVPPPATHLRVIVPTDVEAGKAFKVVIEADDARNRVVPTFRGTVQISLAAPDTGAIFPASFTFSAADLGKHSFQMKLSTTGAQTVKAFSGALFGQSALTVAGPVTHFAVYAPVSVNAGTSFMFTVAALDANNHTVPGYAGTVHVASTDPMAVLPTDYKFQPSDHGNHIFFLTTLNTAAIHTLTVTDVSNPAINGSAQVQVISAWSYYGYGYPYNPYGGIYSPLYGTVVGWGYGWY